ncbi:hypothetical protein BDQ17DRAFT_1387292 [Cyathus striatus]|nr:hypothetical protein BDQ17DRAFT_1387292 [Cyathus striatus]
MPQIHLGAIPMISITSPTPPRPAGLLNGTASATGTPTPKGLPPPVRIHPAYRLLYRGALSLPDSHLLLDGLTFAARLDSPSKHNSLLENPLALALESMRGRPSLRLWSGGIEMNIHPNATLTRIYFENMFCLSPFSSPSTSKTQTPVPTTSDTGIKVALGDSDGPETTEILIYAKISTASTTPNAIRLAVARITPAPTKPTTRLPRPDDPIPRKPPVVFSRELKRVASTALPQRELKRVASVGPGAGSTKRQKLNRSGSLAELGSGVRLGNGNANGEFKIPEVPKTVRKGVSGKGKEKAEDVFGDIAEVVNGSASKAKGRKGEEDKDKEVQTVENANKTMIKKAASNYLSRTKDPTSARMIDKTHPDFKEIWGQVYRGVGFALRGLMKTRAVDLADVEKLVRIHVGMYVGGMGNIPSDALDDVVMQEMD